MKARKNGSSLGAIIEIRCKGVPAGLGEPVYDKLDLVATTTVMNVITTSTLKLNESSGNSTS